MFRECDAVRLTAPRLNRAPPRSNPEGEQEHIMLALGIIFGFIAVLALANLIEFGRVD